MCEGRSCLDVAKWRRRLKPGAALTLYASRLPDALVFMAPVDPAKPFSNRGVRTLSSVVPRDWQNDDAFALVHAPYTLDELSKRFDQLQPFERSERDRYFQHPVTLVRE